MRSGNTWIWENGEPFDYSNWADNQPKEEGTNVMMNKWKYDTAWWKTRDSIVRGVVCERGKSCFINVPFIIKPIIFHVPADS